MTTVRVRLTLIYSGLFLLTSVVLLVIVNTLLRQALHARIERLVAPLPGEAPVAPPAPDIEAGVEPLPPLSELARDLIHYQWDVSALAIGVLTLVSVVVGWLIGTDPAAAPPDHRHGAAAVPVHPARADRPHRAA